MKKFLALLVVVAGLQFSGFAGQSWSVHNKDSDEFIRIFPNPASTYFTIHYDIAPEAYVEIFDVLGTVVAKIDFTSGSDNVYVDCSEWKKGYYFCKFVNNNKVQKTIKLIIQR